MRKKIQIMAALSGVAFLLSGCALFPFEEDNPFNKKKIDYTAFVTPTPTPIPTPTPMPEAERIAREHAKALKKAALKAAQYDYDTAIKILKKQTAYDTNEEIETGLKKFGAMLGDYVEVGCNSVLNPGTVIGKNSNIYPTSCVRGVVPANHIFKDKNNVVKKR